MGVALVAIITITYYSYYLIYPRDGSHFLLVPLDVHTWVGVSESMAGNVASIDRIEGARAC